MPATPIFQFDKPTNSVAALRRSISNRLVYQVGKDLRSATQRDWLFAVFHAVRDRIMDGWRESLAQAEEQDAKRVYYLSLEFLTGRALTNAMMAADIYEPVKQACALLGADFDALIDLEPDAGLGNGGLGRLAACFLDSMATLGLPGMGYGIRYEYGMFAQRIVQGQQVEDPDYWLVNGYPWEFMRPELSYTVRFGGHLVPQNGHSKWMDTEDVIATAYDTGVPGHQMRSVVTMRLWSARASGGVNLDAFNRGDYIEAVEAKNQSENVSRVLYPDDRTEHGHELRLRQEYFFVSASLQDILRRHLKTHHGLEQLADKVAIHLNDTHPALAVPELMRLMLDEHQLDWESAWSLCTRIFSYTNHTLMEEALETWQVDLLSRVLPRHMGLIFDINARFLAEVHGRFPEDHALLRRISLIEERGARRVRMAHLSVLASHKVNGVSALHSQLMVDTIFSDFVRMYPDRFCNKTNGITPRRWLSQANPSLSSLIDSRIGPQWRRDLDELAQLRDLADEPEFQNAFRLAKQQNKRRLTELIARCPGVIVDPHSLFDVQVKRMHEYKRQLLNVLHVISRYHRILAQPHANWVPRTVIFAGKAASAYYMAKLIIRLINDVARVVNNDPLIGSLLRVVFIPNYRVSVAEIIIPAANLSEQISTAGTEASGTGNMKFALNGALTIGTWDGANIEIAENVGLDNIFVFGNRADKVTELRGYGYQPRSYYEGNFDLKLAIDRIAQGAFSAEEPGRYRDVVNALLESDYYQLLADYGDYCASQDKVDELYRRPAAWTRSAILNVAGMGPFSSDRTIREYATDIWGVAPLQ
ncbi:MAG: glycogen/starch/alpha-glucan phosphorylase [Gammaproteobacteria bacterium]|uniref:glycogen/starch/alpha-glucan phosphorylase n=1 Tax=Rhodoferax sp. TaxID=50421 RepID=UPI00181A71D0|nr:glycogen/starch/alpha-glucan phosphorylase [Rhodoferax sp.]MBU3898272.1 glycogen/starch/alpha-glucan phosphorylase [Gammaproteobacteria bacterium]MBA3059030.1 glycogen/starch/alpha-glucan phosphorylase [Rhodoferax sp.]MBU3997022.1 glycogen/starch/alpha-glucan phosphorylase [Gammaproteobacteria bacterium]MBU4081457.1 glycogen/starch/alpha-glucan phosphorylase [Gammaproteobacteria bacterium]MBU4114236.1 glycogen/starch/alpha-glucan phosphorylase [Gammaproteobacteria bacterium]